MQMCPGIDAYIRYSSSLHESEARLSREKARSGRPYTLDEKTVPIELDVPVDLASEFVEGRVLIE